MKIEYFGEFANEPRYSSVKTGTLEELLGNADISRREFNKMEQTYLSQGTKILVVSEDEPEALITLEENCSVQAPDFGIGLTSDQYLIIVENGKKGIAALISDEPADITDGSWITYEGETHGADYILMHV